MRSKAVAAAARERLEVRQPLSRGQAVFVAVTVASLFVAGLAWYPTRPEPTAPQPADAATAALHPSARDRLVQSAVAQNQPPLTDLALAGDAAALSVLEVLPPGELQALRRELADHPGGEAEVQRILAFLSFSRDWARFDEARRSGGLKPDELRALAARLDAHLADRWQKAEITGAQALQLKAVLIEVLMPDANSRREALSAWVAAHQPARPAAANTSAFEREKAHLAAAWQAQPATQRQSTQFEAQLDKLRAQHFTSAPAQSLPGASR